MCLYIDLLTDNHFKLSVAMKVKIFTNVACLHVYFMLQQLYTNYASWKQAKEYSGGAYILSIKKLGARAQKAGNRYDITGRQKLPPPP